MRDATGAVQSVLVLGGGSDIAAATIDALIGQRLQRVVLGVRNPEAVGRRADAWRARGVDVDVVAYDADDPTAHDRVTAHAGGAGDVDVILVAFGILGDYYSIDADTETVAALATTNFASAVAATHASARFLAAQGHGSLVVLSSVAGVRPRPENAVYGAAKAGLDGFAQAVADLLHDTDVHVMVVRPGFVHSKMTTDKEPAPMSTTPEKVAADIVAGLRKRHRVVWTPAVLRGVFTGLRAAPGPIWRRVSR